LRKVEPIAKPTVRVGFYIFRHIFWAYKLTIVGNNLIKIKKIVLKKIVRPKVVICWIIVAMGVLIVTLLLTACNDGSQNENVGYQNLFSDVGPAWSPDGSKIAFVKTTYYNQGSNWGLSGSWMKMVVIW
jgi:hypothetical protein